MKKKFGKKGKAYGDFLSVLLVITIIAILTLVGYLVYKAVSQRVTEANASNANDEFLKVAEQNKKLIQKELDTGDSDYSALQNFIEDTRLEEPEPSATPNIDRSKLKKAYLGNFEIKGNIYIPKTKCNYPILEKSTTEALKKSVGILDIVSGSGVNTKVNDLNIPGTNAFILGHNYLNGQFFSNNDKLVVGDTIQITDNINQTVVYTIYNMMYTSSDDASFMARDIDPNTREITLQTCNDDSSQRLIIFAKDN